MFTVNYIESVPIFRLRTFYKSCVFLIYEEKELD